MGTLPLTPRAHEVRDLGQLGKARDAESHVHP
jgi:hypothetical protein